MMRIIYVLAMVLMLLGCDYLPISAEYSNNDLSIEETSNQAYLINNATNEVFRIEGNNLVLLEKSLPESIMLQKNKTIPVDSTLLNKIRISGDIRISAGRIQYNLTLSPLLIEEPDETVTISAVGEIAEEVIDQQNTEAREMTRQEMINFLVERDNNNNIEYIRSIMTMTAADGPADIIINIRDNEGFSIAILEVDLKNITTSRLNGENEVTSLQYEGSISRSQISTSDFQVHLYTEVTYILP